MCGTVSCVRLNGLTESAFTSCDICLTLLQLGSYKLLISYLSNVYSNKTLHVSAKTVMSGAGQIVSTAAIPKEGHVSKLEIDPSKFFLSPG